MPGAHLLGMICTGHSCFPPRPNLMGSPNVFVNGTPWHRQTDMWGPHSCPDVSPHTAALALGSTTVFANGLGVARMGDPVSCGSFALLCSTNVFAGG